MAAKRKTELAVVGGAGVLMPYAASANRFTEGATRHHRQFFRDYEVAKAHMWQALGDLKDYEVFGDNMLCAVFTRPMVTPGGVITPPKESQEDWWQNKTVMVVKLGPSAFERHRIDTDDPPDDYLRAKFGSVPPPSIGEWLMVNANAGIQMSVMGPGGTRPKGMFNGQEIDLYPGDGWPCRLIKCDDAYMRVGMPHGVV